MNYYTDGSSTIGIKSAYCVTDENGNILAIEESKTPDDKTNNEEEYRGVIKALQLCKNGDTIFTDSMLVVNQINEKWKIKKPHLKPLCEQAKTLLKEKDVEIVWIRREDNYAGEVFE